MQITVMRMAKALAMATTEAERAEIILRRAATRPKSRTTRQARISFTSQGGSWESAMSISDMETMAMSSRSVYVYVYMHMQM